MIKDIGELTQLPLHIPKNYFKKQITPWYQTNKIDYPWRSIWQQQSNPYHIWVSEIMLQQTVIKAVLPKYEVFLKTFPTLEDLAHATEDDIRPCISGLGYYRRFRMLHEACQLLAAKKEQGQIPWPKTFADWKKLPGIGDYTAAAISSIAFNQKVPVVDGNVERVMCRFFNIQLPPNLPKLKKIFFATLSELMDGDHPGDFNQGVMEIGQQVCKVGQPLCQLCPLRKKCLSYENNSQHLAPAPKAKKVFTSIDLVLLINYMNQDSYALVERSNRARFLKGVSGFATYIKDADGQYKLDGDPNQVLDLKGLHLIGETKHSITNHKISLKVYKHSFRKKLTNDFLVPSKDMDKYLTTSLDKKAWKFVVN